MTPETRIQFFASEEPEKPGKYRIIANLGEEHCVTPVGNTMYSTPGAAVTALCLALGTLIDGR